MSHETLNKSQQILLDSFTVEKVPRLFDQPLWSIN